MEWCTKYRFEALRREDIKTLCEASIREAASKHGIEIVELAVDTDHVHTLVGLRPTMSPAHALQLLKGVSSHKIFTAHPNFRKRYLKGHFWSAGKFFRTVGSVDLPTVRAYIANHDQKKLTEFN